MWRLGMVLVCGANGGHLTSIHGPEALRFVAALVLFYHMLSYFNVLGFVWL